MRRLTEEITGFLKDAGFECSVQMRHGLEVVCTVTLDGHHDRVILPIEIEGGTPSEAEKQAAILRAEAQCEARIREAEGEAEAILKVQEATAAGLRMLNEAGASREVLMLKSYEALAKVADGNATKLIIPSDLQGMVGVAATLAETVKNGK